MTYIRVLRTVAAALFLLLAIRPASAGYLQFLLSSELAKNHGPVPPHTSFNGVCQGDADGDCLDDTVENELIQKVNPSYFLDESENCPRMYVYAQARPVGHGVDVWRVDGRVKRVNVTYFYLYEKDCKTFDGHNGDSEHVRFFLSSLDLKTWTLDHGIYWRHSGNKDVDGTHINTLATFIKGVGGQAVNVPPIVASDQDGHGSWEGVSAYSSKCSDDASTIRDCFDKDQARYSTSFRPDILHNIGGPGRGRHFGPERWRTGTPHITVSGSEVYTLRNDIREYWVPSTRFCGWRCPPSNPYCMRSPCAGGLEGKLDKEEFSRQSRPVTPEENGAPYQYQCKFTRNGGPEIDNFGTWTYRGQLSQGHLLYTVVDKAATHYYRLYYSKQIGPKTERWVLESVEANKWDAQPQVVCEYFDVSLAGSLVEFSGPSGACSNGVKQTCYGPP